MTRPGALFLSEIRGQPHALARLLEHGAEYEAVGAEIARRAPAAIRLVGHGSSDAAASYGVYAFGVLGGLTAMRDSISLTVYYEADLDVSMPSSTDIFKALGGGLLGILPIPHDCTDGFCHAWWRRPAAYLDGRIRQGISGIARLPAPYVNDAMRRCAKQCRLSL